jgi:hypothetical protein
MRIRATLLLVTSLALASGAQPAVAQEGSDDCTTVKATLSEYKIKLSKKSAPAGCLEFKVVNRGVEDHELIIFKGRKARALPQQEGVVDEEGLAVLGETGDLATRARATLPVELSPGKYVLFCNVLHDEDTDDEGETSGEHGHGETKSDSHFGEGMHTILSVKRA